MEKIEVTKITISFNGMNHNNSCETTGVVPQEVASALMCALINWRKEWTSTFEGASDYFKEEAKCIEEAKNKDTEKK